MLKSFIQSLTYFQLSTKLSNSTMDYSAADFLERGLKLCGFSDKTIARNGDSINLARFTDKYYVTPSTCEEIFNDLKEAADEDEHDVDVNPDYLLLALYYLKKYPTKHDMAGYLDCSEATALKKSKEYVKLIQMLLPKKIRWIFDEDTEESFDEVYLVSVDGVHCRIWEPRCQPSTGWYSKKFNKAALAYEIGIAIHHNQVVWVRGPLPAGSNDWKIFKEEGLMDKIPEGKLAVGDDGYKYDPKKVATRNQFDTKPVKRFKERAKARHESFNSRLKTFGILNQPFRSTGESRLEKHKAAFEACCVLAQYEMNNGRPLFKI